MLPINLFFSIEIEEILKMWENIEIFTLFSKKEFMHFRKICKFVNCLNLWKLEINIPLWCSVYLFPSCLDISALWISGLSSTIFFLSMWENTMKAFMGLLIWFGECFFVYNNCIINILDDLSYTLDTRKRSN